jgi:IS5 family transposase
MRIHIDCSRWIFDARRVKKNNINYYGKLNRICINVDQGCIRRDAVTVVNNHDSQRLPCLLDLEYEDDYVWADSAYTGKCLEDVLGLAGFESLIHEKGIRNHPLGNEYKQLIRVKSGIRSCVEHVFGGTTMSMGGIRQEGLGWRGPRLGEASRISLSTSFVISSTFLVLQWSHESRAEAP